MLCPLLLPPSHSPPYSAILPPSHPLAPSTSPFPLSHVHTSSPNAQHPLPLHSHSTYIFSLVSPDHAISQFQFSVPLYIYIYINLGEMKIQGAILHLRFCTKLPSFLVVATIVLTGMSTPIRIPCYHSIHYQMKSKSTAIHQWHYFVLACRFAGNPPIVC